MDKCEAGCSGGLLGDWQRTLNIGLFVCNQSVKTESGF